MQLSAGMRNELRKKGYGHLTVGADSLDLKELKEVMPKEFIGVVKRAEEHNKDSLGQIQDAPMELLPMILTNDSSKNPNMVKVYNGILDRKGHYSIPNLGDDIPNIEAISEDKIHKREAERFHRKRSAEASREDNGYMDNSEEVYIPPYVNGDENGDPSDDYVQDAYDLRLEKEAVQEYVETEEVEKVVVEKEETKEREKEEEREEEYEYER